jgi:hypothetical protein
LQVKNKYHAVIKTLEARINNGGHCPHCKHHEFQKWEKPMKCKDIVATKDLPNYIGWRRYLEKHKLSITAKDYLSSVLT